MVPSSLTWSLLGLLTGGTVSAILAGIVANGSSVWAHPNARVATGRPPAEPPGARRDVLPSPGERQEIPASSPVISTGSLSPGSLSPGSLSPGSTSSDSTPQGSVTPARSSVPSWALPWAPSAAPWRDRKGRI